MATKAQVERIFENMKKVFPEDFLNCISESQSGMMAVLRLLDESAGESTAGQISRVLNVSTARVAVLLKKMVAKGLITKEKDAKDGRITRVKLTDFGILTVTKVKAELYRRMEAVIDAVGEERLLSFLEISSEIKTVMEHLTSPEDLKALLKDESS